MSDMNSTTQQAPRDPGQTSDAERGRLLDGKTLAATLRGEVAERVRAHLAAGARVPKLVAILVGDDPASKAYVGSKAKACREVGLAGDAQILPTDTDQSTLMARIDALNADPAVDGILVQLPLPDHLDEREVLARIDPAKDVDGFHAFNVGRLWQGEPGLTPATPTGVIELLRRYDVTLRGAHAVVVGRSNIVGKPMAGLLLREHATVTICHSRTRDLPAVCRGADILVAAVGRAGMIGPDHVRDGAVVVDVGINRVDDRATVERLFPGNEARLARLESKGYVLTGDVDFERVAPKASLITPVPGGVGPLTVALLLESTLVASRRRQGLAA
jgi:methylenetetrahydrofolate dehydrogenase (NADP+)/methenyltetrahydrofolate cyclohydrolase